MFLSWLRTEYVTIQQSHFWIYGSRFIILILNLIVQMEKQRGRLLKEQWWGFAILYFTVEWISDIMGTITLWLNIRRTA